MGIWDWAQSPYKIIYLYENNKNLNFLLFEIKYKKIYFSK